VLALEMSRAGSGVWRERLLARLEARNARRSGGYRLDLSLGAITIDHRAPAVLDELLERADEARRQDKRQKATLGVAGGRA
jgi:hypothetical protein